MKKKIQNIKEQITKQALSKLEPGKLKDTVDQYKKKLNDSEFLEQQKQLASRYFQKAQDFKVKEIVNDAQKLLKSHLGNARQTEDTEKFLIELIQSQNQVEIQHQLKKLTTEQIDQQYLLFSKALGALMLTQHPELEQYLPTESAFIAHYQLARNTLSYFHEQTADDDVRQTIKNIPYRSAFKDFRTLLNAVLAMPNSIKEAKTHLEKIPKNSPYFKVAQCLQLSTEKGSVLARNIAGFDQQQRKCIAEIRGMNEQQFQFIEELAKLRQPLNDEQQINLAIQFHSLADPERVSQFCHRKLAAGVDGDSTLKEGFPTSNKFEQNRIKALLAEQDNNLEAAEYHWRQSIRILAMEDADNDLKIAIVLRHLAKLLPESEQVECLLESLQYDPNDKDSFVQILRACCQKQTVIEDYSRYIEKALQQFSADVDILALVTEMFIQKQDHIKAAEFAAKILEIDPLNSFAKQVVFNGNIELVRSLIHSKNFQQANNALQQVKNINLNKKQSQLVQLLEAFVLFAGQDKQQGLEKIAEIFEKSESDIVNAHFYAAMEAQLAGLPVATILRVLPPVKQSFLSEQLFYQLTQTILFYANDIGNEEKLHKSLGKIKSSLKKSLQQVEIKEKLLLEFCEALVKIRHFELLRYSLKIALTKWPKPIWGYYSVLAETEGNSEQCNLQQYLALKSDLSNAQKQQEHRTAFMIEQYIHHYLQAHPQQNIDMIEDALDINETDFDADFEGPMEQLFGQIPEHEFAMLNKKMESLAKNISPEQLIEQIYSQPEKNKALLSEMMKEPDLYTAMLVLKAADQLKIDINISIDDVLDSFDIG